MDAGPKDRSDGRPAEESAATRVEAPVTGDIENGGEYVVPLDGGGGDGGGGGSASADEPSAGPLRRLKDSTLAEKANTGVACAAVGTSVTAMVLESSPVVYGAGITSAAVAPYSAYQRTRLTDIVALKETHRELQAQVDRLAGENRRLRSSVDELNQTVGNLEECEEALDLITKTQGQSVAAFTEQVKENREILKQMKKNLKATVLQNLLTVIIRADIDMDFTIDESEIENLVTRMKNINGVKVHEERFRNAILRTGGHLQDVIEVVKNLLRGDAMSEEEQIFTITEPTTEDDVVSGGDGDG